MELTKDNVNISKDVIEQEGGMVILSLKEYQKLCRQTVPTYYLEDQKADSLDNLVSEGLHDFKAGKCKKIASLSELE